MRGCYTGWGSFPYFFAYISRASFLSNRLLCFGQYAAHQRVVPPRPAVPRCALTARYGPKLTWHVAPRSAGQDGVRQVCRAL